ncbi:N5-carboxyaminoimidazole ribonucleotide synthase [Promicromonospora soli]|uniref:N5-carboxyaminoimidazole ribonucleotide synthase n=2 Tax=Promicromonospora soli TaxID=2035533 RepID=A0A919KWC6_9MICO|nr:N5-carboxyaminoimidazole ribonucleotide synthase [Promicromonospora soli]
MSATVDSLPADRPSSTGDASAEPSGASPSLAGPPVVAVVGGGQLARMMAPAAGELGIRLRVLVEDPASSAAQVVTDTPVGEAWDEAAIRSLIAPDADSPASVLTFEHEHVPNALLTDLIEHGTPVRPGPHALVQAQDKIVMRQRLTELGVPCPRWAPLPSSPEEGRAALADFLRTVGGTAVVKTSRGGYDGKGVRVLSSPDDVADWFAQVVEGGPQLLVEEKVPFTRELAALVARRPSGEVRAWPVVESVQRDGVCSEVIAPAPGLPAELDARAREIATTVAEGLDVTGVLAVEMFEVAGPDGAPTVLVNELAMRPHNSGHWTIDGAVTSQFEQHLRAVLDLPLGATEATATWTVMANVLGSTLTELTDALPDVLAAYPEARVNLYGKGIRPGRKLGHVNVSGDDLDEVRRRAIAAAALLQGEGPRAEPVALRQAQEPTEEEAKA